MLELAGHGIDVVDIIQFKKMVYERADLSKIFHDDEIAFAEQFNEPWKRLAGCFAAKESFLKALKTGWAQGTQFLDLKLEHTEEGQPVMTVTGVCARTAAALSFDKWLVSLTYTDNLAFASVIIYSSQSHR